MIRRYISWRTRQPTINDFVRRGQGKHCLMRHLVVAPRSPQPDHPPSTRHPYGNPGMPSWSTTILVTAATTLLSPRLASPQCPVTGRPGVTGHLDQAQAVQVYVVDPLGVMVAPARGQPGSGGRTLALWNPIASGLRKRGIGFASLHEALDTTTPGGRLVLHVFVALA
jgi:hypothetical protein